MVKPILNVQPDFAKRCEEQNIQYTLQKYTDRINISFNFLVNEGLKKKYRIYILVVRIYVSFIESIWNK